MAWVLRITDTVPITKRKEYVDAYKGFVAMAPAELRHLGSWRVAYGHALDFMHLWELDSMDAFHEGGVHLSDGARELYGQIILLPSDTHWEWLAPVS